MRSMKFKIIFVTTCLALNINGLFAYTPLSFKMIFDSSEKRDELIGCYGVDKIDGFRPVSYLQPVSNSNLNSKAVLPLIATHGKNDWQMIKMEEGKKYIELDPETEIYIRNGVRYKFKGIHELVAPSKLEVKSVEQQTGASVKPDIDNTIQPTTESSSANTAQPKMESPSSDTTQPKTEQDKDGQPNDGDKPIPTVQDSKPDITGEKKLDHAGERPVIGTTSKKHVISNRFNVRLLDRRDALTFWGDGIDMQTINVLNTLRCSYNPALINFNFNHAASIFSFCSDLETTTDRRLKSLTLNDKLKVSKEIVVTKHNNNNVLEFSNVKSKYNPYYVYVAFMRLFENMSPKLNRFISLYYKYNKHRRMSKYIDFSNFLLAILPEAFLIENYTVDFIEENFKSSIKRTASLFYKGAKSYFVEDNNQLTYNILSKKICAYELEAAAANDLKTNDNGTFVLMNNKNSRLHKIYELKNKKLQSAISVFKNRILNYERFASKAPIPNVSSKNSTDTDSSSKKTRTGVYCPEHKDTRMLCFQCGDRPTCYTHNQSMVCSVCARSSKENNGESSKKSSSLFDSEKLSSSIFKTDIPLVYMNKLLPLTYYMVFEDNAIMLFHKYNAKNSMGKESKNTILEKASLDSREVERISNNPYSDIDTFCSAIQFDLIKVEPTYEQAIALMKHELFGKLKQTVTTARIKSYFATFYCKIIDYFEHQVKSDADKQTFEIFKQHVLENSRDLFSRESIFKKTFSSNIEYIKLIIQGRHFSILELKEDPLKCYDLAGDAVCLVNTIKLDNGEFLEYIGNNMSNKLVIDYVKKLSEIVNDDSVLKNGASNKDETTKFKLDVQSLITFNKFLIEHGIVDEGSVVTNERLDFFID